MLVRKVELDVARGGKGYGVMTLTNIDIPGGLDPNSTPQWDVDHDITPYMASPFFVVVLDVYVRGGAH